jgi:hypothetical protein
MIISHTSIWWFNILYILQLLPLYPRILALLYFVFDFDQDSLLLIITVSVVEATVREDSS